MAETNSPGQKSKAAAERRTADVAKETAAEVEAAAPDADQRAGTDQTPERTDGAPERRDVAPQIDPYPDYDQLDVEALQEHADSRGVEINRDVEKAELIAALRRDDRAPQAGPATDRVDNPYASYDQMPLEALRDLAEQRGVGMDEEVRRAQLVTELRAADSGAGASLSGPAPAKQQ